MSENNDSVSSIWAKDDDSKSSVYDAGTFFIAFFYPIIYLLTIKPMS